MLTFPKRLQLVWLKESLSSIKNYLLALFILFRFTVSQEEHLYFGNLDEETSKWDQFELNKQKFNVLTSYDEKHYTTELDHETIPRQVKQKAEKIVKEILEGDNSQNIHIREERGLVQQTDGNEDEEDKYSGVIRNQI